MEKKEICFVADHDLLRFDGENFAPQKPKECKKRYVAAVVPVDLLRSHTFKLPLSTSEEKLRTLVEIRMYEEGGLDVETEYVIDFVKYPLEFDDSYLIEAYAVEVEKLEALYKEPAAKIGHIDLIAVPYFIYEGLYAFDLFESSNVDLFLRFGSGGCYAVLCKDGRTIAVRVLPGVEGAALKAKVTADVLLQTVGEKGVDEKLYTSDERAIYVAVAEWMAAVAERTAQTVNHKRGIFSFTRVDTIFLDFEGREIPGLWELLDGYGFAQSRKGALLCCERIDASLRHEAVAALYASAAAEERIKALNLTVFEKEPSLWSSHAGKLLAGIITALLLTLATGGYLTSQLKQLRAKEGELHRQYGRIEAQTKGLRKKLTMLRKRRQALQKESDQYRRRIDMYDEAVDVMALIFESKKQRWKMFKDVDIALRRYGLMAASMEQNGSKSITVDLLTPFEQRENIARFMKRLIAKGYQHVQTRRIQLDKTIYRSRVEIVR